MFSQESWLEQHKSDYIQVTSQQFDNRFKKGEVLGSGTFGTVYQVISVEGQIFAIKQFNREAMMNAKQIISEIDNFKRLLHPNIVRFYQFYVVDEMSFRILLQYCEEGNLGKYLENVKLTKVNQLSLVLEIAEGLAYAHQLKIVHRDLKPQNIFMGKGGKAKIGDWGCSTQLKEDQKAMSTIVGSPAYMDHRIVNGNPYDISVDIYALGLIIFFIYKGKGLYDECRSIYTLQKRKSSIYKDYDTKMEEFTEDLPQTIKQIVKNCLNTNFSLRYSAREICKMMEKQIKIEQQKIEKAIISTMDQEDFEDQNTILSIEIIKYRKNLQRKQKITLTKRRILQLLHNYKQKMQVSLQLQTLKYVDSKTKQKFVTFLYFYYILWLNQLEQLVTNQNYSYQEKLAQIDPSSIQPDLKQTLLQKIGSERRRYWQFFVKCCREINSKLRLMNQRLPKVYTEMIKLVCAGINKFDDFKNDEIKHQINLFFKNEVKKQYYLNCGSDNSDEQKLKRLEDLCRNL